MERVEGDCFCSQTMRFLRCSLEFKLLLRHSWKLSMFLKNNVAFREEKKSLGFIRFLGA